MKQQPPTDKVDSRSADSEIQIKVMLEIWN